MTPSKQLVGSPQIGEQIAIESHATDATAKRPDLPALTSIRFIFSLMVVIGHFQGHYAAELPTPPTWIYGFATYAVSFFFVLSGFILTYNYPDLQTAGKIAKFLVFRIARIYPVHVITILATILLFVDSWARTVYLLPLTYWQNVSLTQTWGMIPFTATSFNGPSWSISNEWFFYLMFPLVISRNKIVCSAAVILPIAASLLIKLHYGCLMGPVLNKPFDPQEISGTTVYSLFPPSRFIEFLAGVLLCKLMRPTRKLPIAMLQIGALAIAVVSMDGNASSPTIIHGLIQTIWTPAIGCLIIGSLSVQNNLVDLILVNRPLIFLGEISFSVYMTHLIVFQWFWLHADLLKGITVYLKFVILFGITIAASSLLFLCVESPMRLGTRALFKRCSTPAAVAVACLFWATTALVVWAIGYAWFVSTLKR